jgi:hypothetical protein
VTADACRLEEATYSADQNSHFFSPKWSLSPECKLLYPIGYSQGNPSINVTFHVRTKRSGDEYSSSLIRGDGKIVRWKHAQILKDASYLPILDPYGEHPCDGEAMNPVPTRSSARQAACRMLVEESRPAQVETVTLIRCPQCQKMLAKCAMRGMIEIACPRCKTLVKNTFT